MWHIDHVVTCKVKTLYLHIHKAQGPPKLARVLNQDEGAQPKKLRDTPIVWWREKSKPSYFLNHRAVEM